jgi:hypothetical protein
MPASKVLIYTLHVKQIIKKIGKLKEFRKSNLADNLIH